MSHLRFLWTAWLFHLRQMATVKIYIFDSVLLPLILATIAVRLIGAGEDSRATTSVILGAALMGMWSSTLSGTGGALGRMRTDGILEPIIAGPMPLPIALAANALASSTLGIYSVVATLIWARFGLGLELEIDSPFVLAIATLLTIVATAALGLLLSVSLVMYPRAQSVSNIFEYPIWLLTGAVLPLAALPGWVSGASLVIAPAWGMKAITAAVDGDGRTAAAALGACLLISACYWVLSAFLLRYVENLARERATLPLS